MFWDNFVFYCSQKGVAPNVAAAAVGVKSSGTVTGWKNGAMPRQSILKKLADYFEIPVELLINASPLLWNAARESVANQDFAKLPIEQREAMLKAAKEKAPGPQAESDLERRFRAAAAKLPPDFLEREIAYLEQKAQQLHVPTDSDM